ncbi:hypothetical protein HN031_06560 [Nocardioides sp. zg-1308]|uniref:hypothetical protein n=1 Tax=Nocardioides sp. zg-1308 TaxID=2736253 RepID=UPI001556C545|nr:hypothetical protein [Nocardioides sp. zg-1308]NPD04348.1 hypothetical protein [Nocardioides sp. zg-1308]
MGNIDEAVARLRDALASVEDLVLRSRRDARRTSVGSVEALARGQHQVPDRPTDGSYVQPDRTTCGSSSLVMSRMLHDPAYASWIATGHDAGTGRTDPRSPGQRFADESLAMHDRTNGATGRDGRLQLPWPKAVGTQPWAVAAEMSAASGSGVPGRAYEVRTVAPRDRGTTWDHIAAAVDGGHHVPLYVGNARRPGHVVLVIGGTGDDLTLYDPASGRARTVSRQDFSRGHLGVSGWDEPWFAVTPVAG